MMSQHIDALTDILKRVRSHSKEFTAQAQTRSDNVASQKLKNQMVLSELGAIENAPKRPVGNGEEALKHVHADLLVGSTHHGIENCSLIFAPHGSLIWSKLTATQRSRILNYVKTNFTIMMHLSTEQLNQLAESGQLKTPHDPLDFDLQTNTKVTTTHAQMGIQHAHKTDGPAHHTVVLEPHVLQQALYYPGDSHLLKGHTSGAQIYRQNVIPDIGEMLKAVAMHALEHHREQEILQHTQYYHEHSSDPKATSTYETDESWSKGNVNHKIDDFLNGLEINKKQIQSKSSSPPGELHVFQQIISSDIKKVIIDRSKLDQPTLERLTHDLKRWNIPVNYLIWG